MSFKVSPLTYDLIANKNENAIARSIRNLILTTPGERPFNPELGSQVSRLLFEPIDSITTQACLLYTSPSPRDLSTSRMPSSA